MKVEKHKVLIDGGMSAMMTMRRRPLADRSRLELRPWKVTAANSLIGGATRRLVLADRKARRPGRSATVTRGPRYLDALS